MDVAGIARGEIEEFLEDLARRGRGSYTRRSYRLGLADFARWLDEQGCPLGEVSRRDVERYVTAFAAGRSARTVNHRVSVLASFFAYLVGRDGERGDGVWAERVSPVPAASPTGLPHGRPGGGDAPRGRRGELRRREPRRLPRDLDPVVVQRLIDGAASSRDRALLILLARTGQRIGDWSDEHGRHGLLGMTLEDLDRRGSTIVVRLKGARDEHRVPVTTDFWAAFDHYLGAERGDPPTRAAWVGARRAAGRPLSYPAFEAALRQLAGRLGVTATAHMFRHTVATQLTLTAGPKIAQDMLGHRHVSTTLDTYAHVDLPAMVTAVAAVEAQARAAVIGRGAHGESRAERYAFQYDPGTIAELDAIAVEQLVAEEPR